MRSVLFFGRERISLGISLFTGKIFRNAGEAGKSVEEEEIAPGNLFATGLVAGGAIAGVIVAILMVIPAVRDNLSKVNIEPTFVNWFGDFGYEILGVLFFLFMGFVLYNIGAKKQNDTN